MIPHCNAKILVGYKISNSPNTIVFVINKDINNKNTNTEE